MIAESTEGVSRMAAPHEKLDRAAGKAKWDQPAFEQVFLENFNRVVGVLFRLLGDGAQAEELANEVFWKLYHLPLLPEPEGNLNGWLYRTATNLGIDALRVRAKRKRYEEGAALAAVRSAAADDPLSEVLREEQRSRVRTVLALLKPAQAQVLILRHSGFSYDEIAEIMAVSRGSVGTMLIRAEAEFHRRYVQTEAKELGRPKTK